MPIQAKHTTEKRVRAAAVLRPYRVTLPAPLPLREVLA